ncbi:MAG: hypothetical protein HOL77_16835, partial [Rhodobacteraceae bacterium]|nr:hypothetical protein [Paracoccaceae bacterium]
MTDLRASIFINQLQPQTLAYVATWMRGTLPRLRMAAQIVEIAPGLDVEALTDTVLKSADVRAGLLVVERQFGTLQFHSHSTAEVHSGAGAILRALGKTMDDVAPPKILASKLVTNVDDQHAFLMNRNKLGSMVLGGDSIYLLECQSAAYAILACNEAEKEADVKLIDMR